MSEMFADQATQVQREAAARTRAAGGDAEDPLATGSGRVPGRQRRPVALVTGVGRTAGLGAAVAMRLAAAGWDVATTHLTAYDARMPWGEQPGDPAEVGRRLREAGARTVAVEADLADPAAPARVLDAVEGALGPVTALVLSHCESVDSDLLGTSVESFDRHYAVNVRATWLLVRELARRLPAALAAGAPRGSARVVALTSDHTVGNLPYGATKGAADRVVLAAATELAPLGVSANVVNPGPVDTGWMDDAVRAACLAATPAGRLGTPADTADLVEFLLSARGGWVTGQLLRSNGGFRTDA